MCAVRHTVYDPRRETVLRSNDLFGFAPTACSSPPPRSSPSPLHPIHESSSSSCVSKTRPGAALARQQPWQSPAVADFARRVGDDGSLKPMMLQGPRGTALKAVGEAADHESASRAVADIEARRSQPQPGPRVDHVEARLPDSGKRRNAVRRGTDVALAMPEPSQQTATTFGAVYEYRDSCGTAKLVASTSKLPERQFALDQRHYEDVLSKSKDPALVWVGISGGRGALNEAEMTEVRREVTNARAKRLHIEKLGDIKPYSRHG